MQHSNFHRGRKQGESTTRDKYRRKYVTVYEEHVEKAMALMHKDIDVLTIVISQIPV